MDLQDMALRLDQLSTCLNSLGACSNNSNQLIVWATWLTALATLALVFVTGLVIGWQTKLAKIAKNTEFFLQLRATCGQSRACRSAI